jgi:hypothetical protein
MLCLLLLAEEANFRVETVYFEVKVYVISATIMSKICAQCSKTVYPLEELKCLDKVSLIRCFIC